MEFHKLLMEFHKCSHLWNSINHLWISINAHFRAQRLAILSCHSLRIELSGCMLRRQYCCKTNNKNKLVSSIRVKNNNRITKRGRFKYFLLFYMLMFPILQAQQHAFAKHSATECIGANADPRRSL